MGSVDSPMEPMPTTQDIRLFRDDTIHHLILEGLMFCLEKNQAQESARGYRERLQGS